MINKDSYVTIPAFMRNELNLKGNELITYAIIHGFSQDGQSKFTGSASYIAEWLGVSRRSVVDILKKLVEKNLITKYKRIEKGTTLCDYAANFLGYEKSSQGVKKLHTPCEETSHHNIEDNIVNIIKEDFDDHQEMWLEIVNLWIDYKKKQYKFTYKTDYTLKAFVRNLKKLSGNDVYKAKEIILQSISNGWSGIFALKEDKRNGGGNEYNPYL